jgi:hypothetical protein
MVRIIWALTVAGMAAAGCRSSYRVQFNGYSELAEPISRQAPIYVATDPNAENLIFQKQIQAKAERLLRGEGYTLAESAEKAAYEIVFRVGTRSQEVLDRRPTPEMRAGFLFGGYSRGFGFGHTTYYAPYYDTLYSQWLVVRLFRNDRQTQHKQLVWVGEAAMRTDRPALRQAVDYLLVACIEHLGIDTREQITVRIGGNDPRVLDIAAEP